MKIGLALRLSRRSRLQGTATHRLRVLRLIDVVPRRPPPDRPRRAVRWLTRDLPVHPPLFCRRLCCAASLLFAIGRGGMIYGGEGCAGGFDGRRFPQLLAKGPAPRQTDDRRTRSGGAGGGVG